MSAAQVVAQALLGVPLPAARAALRLRWQQMPVATRWGWAGLVLFFVALAAAIAWLVGRRHAAPVLFSGLAAVLMLAWGGQVAGLLEQNQPQLARLVPGHVRVLRHVAVALWAALALVLGAVAWVAFGRSFEFWGCVLVVGALAAALAWCARWPLLWVVFSVLPGLWPVLSGGASLHAAWLQALEAWRAYTPASTAAVLMLLALSVAAIFGRGDARHDRAFERRRAWRWLESPRPADAAARRGPALRTSTLAWLVWPLAAVGNAWLARLLRQASPSRRSVMARAELVLHGCHHWMWHLQGVTAVLLVLALVLLALGFTVLPDPARIPMEQVWWKGQVGIAVALASLALNLPCLLPRALHDSRREQALLLLLPGLPRGPALNAAVTRLQLRHAGLAWACMVLPALAVYAAAGTALALCVALVALPVLVAWLLRPPALQAEASKLRNALPMVAILVGGALLLTLLGGWRVPVAPAALGGAAATSLVLALGLGWHGWRRVVAAPTALPAGRLG